MHNWKQSSGPLALLVLLVLTALILFVGYGWWFLFEKPLQSGLAAGIGAFFFSAIALLLVRRIGERRARQQLEQGATLRWHQGLAAYLFLFFISALGTINAAFVLFEGSAIVRHDIAIARAAYGSLKIEAARTLYLESFEQRRVQLETELKHLQIEIDNPNGGHYCGVGQKAELILDKIRLIVPDMPRIAGTGVIRPCNSSVANRLWKAYADSARSTLNEDPAYLASRGSEKAAFLDRLDKHIATIGASLDAAEAELTDVTAFSRPSIQSALANAADTYAGDRAVYADLIKPEPSKVPEAIDISASQDLGSIAAVSNIMVKRFAYTRTWFYFFIAVLLDLGTIYLLTHVYALRMRSDEIPSIDSYSHPGPNPRFLWVNAKVDAEKRVVRRV